MGYKLQDVKHRIVRNDFLTCFVSRHLTNDVGGSFESPDSDGIDVSKKQSATCCLYSPKIDKVTDWMFIESEKVSGIRHATRTDRRWAYREIYKNFILKKYSNHKVYDNTFNVYSAFIPDHHLSHAYGSYVQSPYTECLCIVVDGGGRHEHENGEFAESNMHLYHIKNQEITRLAKFDTQFYQQSLGLMYTCIGNKTKVQGLHREGKVMGLAEYGDDFTDLKFSEFVEKGDNLVRIDYPENYDNCNNIKHKKHKYLNKFDVRQQIASSLQATFEYRLFEVCRYLNRLHLDLPVVITGGCAMNATFIGKLLRSKMFPDVFVSSTSEDEGNSIGFAFMSLPTLQKVPLLKYTQDERQFKTTKQEALKDFKKTSKEEIARLLKQGKVVAWFEGAVEVGARALCHRSLLADPSIPGINDVVNNIKKRELWRPLAPVVLDTVFEEMFNVKPHQTHEIMQATEFVSPEYAVKYPACTSVASTARPQIIYEDQGVLYELMSEFDLPVLINTSLNGPGQAIIMYLEWAIEFIKDKKDLYLVYIDHTSNNELLIYDR